METGRSGKGSLKRLFAIFGIALAVVLLFVLVAFPSTYKAMITRTQAGDFSGAAKADWFPYITRVMDEDMQPYIEAGQYYESGDYFRAWRRFENLGNYMNSRYYYSEAMYRDVADSLAIGDYETVIARIDYAGEDSDPRLAAMKRQVPPPVIEEYYKKKASEPVLIQAPD